MTTGLLTIITALILLETSFLTYKILRPTRSASIRNGVFIDTSVLMDGRITTAARTGFVPTKLVIPLSVVNELHLLSDQADPEKRQRARHGLDVIAELQSYAYLSVIMHDDGTTKAGGVDQRLITLAKQNNGSICTIDFNLNKVASVQGVRVLNLNELASNIRMAYLPGESFSVALTQKGQDASQAVGHLVDGTMVVIDKAATRIGHTVEVEATRSLQTSAGRMIFAKLVNLQPEPTRRGGNENKSDNSNGGRKHTKADTKSARDQRTLKRQTPARANNRKTSLNAEDSLINLVNDQ